MSPLTVLILSVTSTSIYICGTVAEAPSKGDRGDPVTLDSISSTGAKDLLREATRWERPTYGTENWYPPQGNNKGYSRSGNVGHQGQGYQRGNPRYVVNPSNQGGYQSGYQSGYQPGYQSGYQPGYQSGYQPGYQGGYQGGYKGGYVPQNRGGHQPGYGNNKGWSSAGSGYGGNYGRPWPSGGYQQGNYKGGSTINQGWNRGQGGYGGGWSGGNQIRPNSGGYNWPAPSTGYRGEKGSSGSYGGGNWGYGVNQGTAGSGYGGGYVNQGLNKGLGNQIYGSGYGGGYTGAGQKGWSNPGYVNPVPSQGGWGSSTWDSYGYQGNYKGGSSPRSNTIDANTWSDPRGGYINYSNNKGWW